MINRTQEEIMQDWGVDNSDTPLVSVRCITYNHEPYIAQALDGFLMQKTNFPFEVIVHDDASPDKTADIIREYEAKFPKIIKPIYETENQYSKHDGSLGRIVNAALKGKYIAFCEGDDYWIDENKLQRQVEFLENNDSYSMSTENARIDYLKTGEEILFSSFPECDITLENLFEKRRFATASVLCRYNDYLEIVQLNKQLYDIHIWCLLAEKGKIHYNPIVSSVYRRGAGVTENNKISWAYCSEYINRTLEKMFQIPSFIKKKRDRILYHDLLHGLLEAINKKKLKHIFVLSVKVLFYRRYFIVWFLSDCKRKLTELILKINIMRYQPKKGVDDKKKNEMKVIISLTSYPDRFVTLDICLKSLLWQRVKPNRIILNIYKNDFLSLPENVKKLQEYGIELNIVPDDLKPHKKYYYVMQNNPNDIVVTVDDDCIYDRNMLKNLLLSYKKFPKCISATVVHKIIKKNNRVVQYKEWENDNICSKPSNSLVAIGIGGVLYPPSSQIFDSETFNKEKIRKLCINADDLWLKFMELRNHIEVVKVPKCPLLPCQIDETKKSGLYFSNMLNNKNDYYINLLEKEYGISLNNYADDNGN